VNHKPVEEMSVTISPDPYLFVQINRVMSYNRGFAKRIVSSFTELSSSYRILVGISFKSLH